MKNLAIAYGMKNRAKKQRIPMDQESDQSSMPKESAMGLNPDEHDLVNRIMNKRKMMAEGGLIEDDDMGEASSHPDQSENDFDYLGEGDLDDSSTNSGASDGDDLGNAQEEKDRQDIVSRIMKQRSMKSRNPNPA